MGVDVSHNLLCASTGRTLLLTAQSTVLGKVLLASLASVFYLVADSIVILGVKIGRLLGNLIILIG